MKVIFNGDDFGYSKGQNLGILECFKEGVISSTSLMTNMPGFDHAISLMKENSDLNVGIHFVMTVGKAVGSGYKTITDENGFFIRDMERLKKADKYEIKREYRAQFNKFIETGFFPTHIDFHVGVIESQYNAAIEIAKEYNIPLRAMGKQWEGFLDKHNVKHSKNFNENFYDEGVTLENLIAIFEENKDKDLIEIMSHPAYIDSVILENSSYNLKRADELKIITSSEIKEYVEKNKIELISYKDL